MSKNLKCHRLSSEFADFTQTPTCEYVILGFTKITSYRVLKDEAIHQMQFLCMYKHNISQKVTFLSNFELCRKSGNVGSRSMAIFTTHPHIVCTNVLSQEEGIFILGWG